jgi:hypothetical protein
MLKLNKDLIKSTAITILVSCIGGLGGYILNIGFIPTFLLFFVFQYILFFALSTLVVSYFKEKTKQKELDKLESLSTILNCAYCNQSNIMTFIPNDNSKLEFTCESCKKQNSVTMNFVVARLTEPINIPKVSGIPLE